MLTQKKTKAIMLGDTPVKKVMFRDKQIRPEELVFTPLGFTAQEANSTVALNKNGYPTVVELEVSADGNTWTDYTIGDAITLANVGDKVYMRNKSETDTGFSIGYDNFYQFAMTGKISYSGDITSLLNKNGTTTLSNFCYYNLFFGCTSLITAPELPATTLAGHCYDNMFVQCTSLTTAPELPATTLDKECYFGMFYLCTSLTTPPELPATTLAFGCYANMFVGCTSLTTLPELPATNLASHCYDFMFNGCTNIKLSETQTGEYQIPYRIPASGTGTTATNALDDMFSDTGGTFKGTPTINTTYYLRSGAAPVTTAGIYHNETEGLISLSSDGESWITIADKNLGATQVWNSGDTLSEANCGKYYQRGNNYGFPRTGSVTTSSTQVDASAYGPGNYYSSSTFIIRSSGSYRWDTTNNGNLWGGETGTNEAMQGPAPAGFHVPLATEWQAVKDIRVALGGGSSDGTNFGIALRLPFAGRRNHLSADVNGQGSIGGYWSTTAYSADDANYLYFNSADILPNNGYYRSRGFSVRCFKNNPVTPDSTRTVLYQPN